MDTFHAASASMARRSISLILSTFEDVLVPRKHSSVLRIKEKFSLAFIHALILLLGSFLLLGRCSPISEKKRLHSLLSSKKHEKTSGVNDPCSIWRIRRLYSRFFSFSFFIWTAGRLWHLANGLKTLTSQKAVFLLIHNPLADTSALAWLLVSEDLRNSSPVSRVSIGLITTFLQTSPNISAVRFLSSLCRVITSPPFGQDKTCCKLNESPQTHIVGKRYYIIYIWFVLHTKRLVSPEKKTFLFIGITVNQIDVPFSVDPSIDLNFVLHDVLLLTSCIFASFSFFLLTFEIPFYFFGWYAIILKLNFVKHSFISCFFGGFSRIFISFLTKFRWKD